MTFDRPVCSAIAVITLLIALCGPTSAQSRLATVIPELTATAPSARQAGSACVLRNHGDTLVSFYSGIIASDRYATYINPARCAGLPDFPFQVQSIAVTLYDVLGSNWPVEVDVEIWYPAGADSCSGPGSLVCSRRVQLTKPVFAPPNVGTINLSSLCCVSRPFFVALRYTGGSPAPFPSVLFDNRMPGNGCVNWGYAQGFGWDKWPDYWSPPIPGNMVVWVNGESNAAICAASGCCSGIRGNVDGDPGDVVDGSDLGALVEYIFFTGTLSTCAEENNVDGDPGNVVDGSDLQAMVDFVFFDFPMAFCP